MDIRTLYLILPDVILCKGNKFTGDFFKVHNPLTSVIKNE